MKLRRTMARRVTVMATGIALTSSVGLMGAGVASSATPALHIKNDGQWTLLTSLNTCENLVFESNGTFVGDQDGDMGKWSGGARTLSIKWTAGVDSGLKFKGTYNKMYGAYYGTLGGTEEGQTGAVGPGPTQGC
jgi:hypothetical protein